MRTPDQTEGDLWAQLTGLDLLERRLGELMHEYGLDDLEALCRGDPVALRARHAPGHPRAADGRLSATRSRPTAWTSPSPTRSPSTSRDDRIVVDYAGTSAQVDRAINCPITYTYAMTAYALKCALLPNLPNNEGIFRCIEVTAPEGSLVNPRYPAAVGGRMATGHYIPIAVFGALHPCSPSSVIAASGSPLWSLIQTGVRAERQDLRQRAVLQRRHGRNRQPATAQSTYAWPSNVSNVPVELIERNARCSSTRKELRARQRRRRPAPRRARPGDPVRGDVRNPGRHDLHGRALPHSRRRACNGGGARRARAVLTIDGQAVDHRRNVVLTKGQPVRLATPGGGGFGPVAERAADAVADDLRLGYTSPTDGSPTGRR